MSAARSEYCTAECNFLPEDSNKKKVVIGCSGSVASLNVPTLAKLLVESEYSVVIVATDNALKFFKLQDLPSSVQVFADGNEWKMWQKIGDPILHIELRRWADLMVVAPMNANTLAKCAGGICDNLLTCITRAWDNEKPMLFCPAMNTTMWNHPITSQQIEQLKSWGCLEVPCVKKKLACGDIGLGGMAEVDTIFTHVQDTLKG